MDYDFVLLTEMNDYIGSFNYPLDISGKSKNFY